jgi:high-affinity Fe2+/Pb2+ permease
MRPVYWRAFFLLGLSLALGWGMEYLLESIDYSRFVAMIGFLITFLLAYVAFAGPVLRLQEKAAAEISIPHQH